jgi:hypothetical protein
MCAHFICRNTTVITSFRMERNTLLPVSTSTVPCIRAKSTTMALSAANPEVGPNPVLMTLFPCETMRPLLIYMFSSRAHCDVSRFLIMSLAKNVSAVAQTGAEAPTPTNTPSAITRTVLVNISGTPAMMDSLGGSVATWSLTEQVREHTSITVEESVGCRN